MTSKLEKLERIDPDIVYDFLVTGKSQAISKSLQIYICQLQWASEIWETERNTMRAAKKLKERILVNQGKVMSLHACKTRVFDSMAYFDVDTNIASDVWDRDSANKLEDLAKLAIAEDKLDVAKRCYERANEYRVRASTSIKPADLRPPLFLINTNISPEDLGFKSEKLFAISRKSNEGYYAKLISELPIEKQEKLRLLADAEIEDVDFEEIEEDGDFPDES